MQVHLVEPLEHPLFAIGQLLAVPVFLERRLEHVCKFLFGGRSVEFGKHGSCRALRACVHPLCVSRTLRYGHVVALDYGAEACFLEFRVFKRPKVPLAESLPVGGVCPHGVNLLSLFAILAHNLAPCDGRRGYRSATDCGEQFHLRRFKHIRVHGDAVEFARDGLSVLHEVAGGVLSVRCVYVVKHLLNALVAERAQFLLGEQRLVELRPHLVLVGYMSDVGEFSWNVHTEELAEFLEIVRLQVLANLLAAQQHILRCHESGVRSGPEYVLEGDVCRNPYSGRGLACAVEKFKHLVGTVVHD